MIVCHCEVVNDRTIAACAAAGHTSVEAITAACSAGGDCGRCHETIERIVDEVVETVTAVTIAA
ncbi:MAG: (2Fe-2S)-binding protein [Acidimicrobiales bacterium]